MRPNFNIRIRMGAPYWDVTVNHKGTLITFDMRKLEREKKRNVFHREFMNAFRASRRQAA